MGAYNLLEKLLNQIEENIGNNININELAANLYISPVQVKNFKNIAPGFELDTFDASLCARFHYIGKHHYYEINADIARGMYNAIVAFVHDKDAKYDSYHTNYILKE